jgi:hypothetical protein
MRSRSGKDTKDRLKEEKKEDESDGEGDEGDDEEKRRAAVELKVNKIGNEGTQCFFFILINC